MHIRIMGSLTALQQMMLLFNMTCSYMEVLVLGGRTAVTRLQAEPPCSLIEQLHTHPFIFRRGGRLFCEHCKNLILHTIA